MNNGNVLVCQRGARHRYAVPALFEAAGMLTALYTDSCGFSAMGRLAKVFAQLKFGRRSIAALAERIPRDIPKEKVYSTDHLLLPAALGGSHSLAPVYRKWGLGQANIIYSMYGEEPDFLEWAKAKGAKVIVDVFVHPLTNRIIDNEENRILGVPCNPSIDDELEHSRKVFNLADVLVCPSSWVADGVKSFMPSCENKIRIVPYGSSVKTSGINNDPIPGTILFAGREPLRKGLHYLAEAAHLMRQDGLKIDVRVAGISADEISWIKHKSELNCLGIIPLSEMKKEYAKSDMFVLPSLSEGQAGVLLEAMACGVPVVATRESGVDFDSDCGVTVPTCNATVLAEAIKSIITDRDSRKKFADGALKQSAMFTMDEWKKRLIHVVEELSP